MKSTLGYPGKEHGEKERQGRLQATQQTVLTKWQGMLCTHAVQVPKHCLHLPTSVHPGSHTNQ